jgi:hypothetical protein
MSPVVNTESFVVVSGGRTRDAKQLYNILRHNARHGSNRGADIELRCRDLWWRGYAVDQGCNYVQYIDEPYDLRCYGCGLKFSKLYLRQAALISIEGVPADH